MLSAPKWGECLASTSFPALNIFMDLEQTGKQSFLQWLPNQTVTLPPTHCLSQDPLLPSLAYGVGEMLPAVLWLAEAPALSSVSSFFSTSVQSSLSILL